MSAPVSRVVPGGLIVRDPDVSVGRYRVLARTDGQYAIIDDALPLGQKTVALARTVDDAKKKIKELPP